MPKSEEQLDKNYPISFKVAGGVIIGILLLVGSMIVFNGDDIKTVIINLYSEVLIISTIGYILNLLQEARENERLKAQLVRELSATSGIAMRAIEELRIKGWLSDGSLKGSMLIRACLAGADLAGANLEEVQLVHATLNNADLRYITLKLANLGSASISNAILWEANLSGASLYNASLDGAKLQRAELKEADLCFSDLRGARLERSNLCSAKLHGANLKGANLKGANLEGVTFVHCILPNGKRGVTLADLLPFTE